MRKLLVRPRARLDLLEIWDHLSKQDRSRADRIAGQIENALQSLCEMPGKGHRRQDIADPRYRFWAVHSWLIAYRFDDIAVTIVRVVHGARDIRRVMS